jgi:HAMP domain-containing protein
VKPSRDILKYFALCSAAVLMVACANQMEPAKNALDNINATLTAASADAQKYIPDQLADAQSKVAALTASFDKKDYAAVVAGAPAVLAEVNGLAGAAAAKRDEVLKALGNEWRSLAASMPQSVTAVQTRIDALSKARHVPKDIDLTTARSGLADATSAWEKAQTEFKSGDASDAVTAGKDAKTKLEAAAAALKLTLPQAAA